MNSILHKTFYTLLTTLTKITSKVTEITSMFIDKYNNIPTKEEDNSSVPSDSEYGIYKEIEDGTYEIPHKNLPKEDYSRDSYSGPSSSDSEYSIYEEIEDGIYEIPIFPKQPNENLSEEYDSLSLDNIPLPTRKLSITDKKTFKKAMETCVKHIEDGEDYSFTFYENVKLSTEMLSKFENLLTKATQSDSQIKVEFVSPTTITDKVISFFHRDSQIESSKDIMKLFEEYNEARSLKDSLVDSSDSFSTLSSYHIDLTTRPLPPVPDNYELEWREKYKAVMNELKLKAEVATVEDIFPWIDDVMKLLNDDTSPNSDSEIPDQNIYNPLKYSKIVGETDNVYDIPVY